MIEAGDKEGSVNKIIYRLLIGALGGVLLLFSGCNAIISLGYRDWRSGMIETVARATI